LTERLSIIDRVLTVSGMEFEFAKYYLEQVRRQAAMTLGKGEVELNQDFYRGRTDGFFDPERQAKSHC